MLDIALEVGKVQITWLEAIAFVLALACVICNVLEIHWGWPLAIVSSGLYCWLFYNNRLYGDAGIQIYFVLASGWGWWHWVRPVKVRTAEAQESVTERLRVQRLSRRGIAWVAGLWLALWGILAIALSHWTDSDVAWADAFPTAGSLIGQVLLGRKFIENWVVWQGVNVAMVGLLAYKSLWLTMLLYCLFWGMAVLGWRRWSRVSA